MNRSLAFVFCLLFASSAFAACGTTNASIGKTFTLSMASNATTGYGWKLASSPSPEVMMIGHKYIAPNSKLVGAGGKEIWQFKALKKGKKTLIFNYVRPWEKGKPPASVKSFCVIIK
ncbi:MAG TPA: protease inhibitor I42 family protein [Candidatus Omnitrophota bacterium]|nr:protease inhibitor I42 family protein [Candidatus Omnitrophota bacterium]